MISEEIIEKLLNSLKIEKVVGDFIELKKVGKNYKGLCPFHNDTNPSFYVSPQKQYCKCFTCSTGGDAISFYQKIKNVSFNQAIKELAKKYNVDLGINLDAEYDKNDNNEKYYTIMEESHNFYKKNIFETRTALEYLANRGLDTDLIKEYEIGYANTKRSELYDLLHNKGYEDDDLLKLGLIKKNEEGKIYDTFRNRIIFPIFSPTRKIIAFGGRTLEKGENIPKYINSSDTPIFKKSYNLFGIERAYIIKNKNYSILMEGYMDILTANIFGFDTSIAPLGTALTIEQVKLLKKYTNNILLSFDMDKAGRTATEKAIFLLKSQEFNIKVLDYYDSKDPDDFLRKNGKESFLKVVKNSLEAFDYLYNYYLQEYDDIENNIMAKENFIKRFNEFFLSLNNDIEKELYLQKLSEKVNVNIEALKKTVFSIQNKKEKNVKEETVKEENKINDIEFKIIKLLLNNPKYVSFFEKEISKNELVNSTLEFIKNNNSKDNLIKEFQTFIKNNSFSEKYKNEISLIIIDSLITDNNKQNLEILKSYFRSKIKEVFDINKEKFTLNFNEKIELLKLKNDINLINNIENLKKFSDRFNKISVNNI